MFTERFNVIYTKDRATLNRSGWTNFFREIPGKQPLKTGINDVKKRHQKINKYTSKYLGYKLASWTTAGK